MDNNATITVTIDIGEAARRVLVNNYQARKAELDEIALAVSKAEWALDEFMRKCGLPDEVKLISVLPESAVRG